MDNQRIRKNDRVFFIDSGNWEKQGLVENIYGGLMDIRLDGYGGKVVHTARREGRKWLAYGYEKNDYVLEVFKM